MTNSAQNEATAIAFQGVPGAYSEQAIWSYAAARGLSLQPVPTENFADLFAAITGEVGLGMVPIENSTAGSVTPAYDLMATHDVEIIGEWRLPIHHHLLAPAGTGLDQISEVISHPQALAQCRVYLDQHGIAQTPFFDTAGSAQELVRNPVPGRAAIASKLAAEIYDLAVLSDDIQTNTNNTTRFWVVKAKDREFVWEGLLPTADKTSLIFVGRDIPAALYKCLGGFATNGVSMTKLESRPRMDEQFAYVTYVDFMGALSDNNVALALEELEHFTTSLTPLGSYKSYEAPSE